MSNKGIIIDVGFTADIKELIDTIEGQFKSVDFSNMIGLSKAFDEQAKDVRKQLAKLKDEIDLTINGKVKNDPSKQMQALNKSVSILTSSLKEMIKVMPASQASQLIPGLDDIITDMNHMSDMCGNVADAIGEVKKVADGDIQLVNTDKLKELEELYKVFVNLERQAEKTGTTRKKSGNIPYKDYDEVLRDITASYKQYYKIQNQIADLEDNNSISDSEKNKELDRLNNQYIQMSINLQRLISTYENFKGSDLGTLIKVDGGKTSIGDIREELEEEFDNLLSYVSKRKAEIQSEVYSLGGGNLDALIEDTSQALKSNKLTVPISISKKESTLLKDALAIISGVQSKIDGNPLQVEVAFVSQYRTKRNKELLEQISGSLDNISNEEIKNKLSNLVDDLNKQIGDELLIDVKVQGSDKASDAVRELIQDLQSQIDEADFTVYPEIKMTDEVKQKLQSDIDELSKITTINIGFKDEAGEAIGTSSIEKEVRNISELRQELEKVITAIDNKTIAFQVEEQTVSGVVSREISSLAELITWLNIVEDNVTELSSYFRSLSTNFKIDFTFSDGSVESITSLINDDTLSKLSNIKQIITSLISSNSGDLIEIPEVQKKKLLKDVKTLSTQINSIFEIKSIDKWSSKFISSLTEISNKIKTLFGSNALSDMIDQWISSDEIMLKKRGADHLKERAAVIDDNGNIHGSGTYDQHGSTVFISKIVEELQSKGIVPKIGIHSHGSDRIAASSIPQGHPASYADLGADYISYIQKGLEKQLTIALNDIELFDAKGFYDSNSDIDFSDYDIRTLIRDKQEELSLEIGKNFYQYFKDFISQYGTGNGLNLKDELFDNINVDSDGNKLKNAIKDVIDPNELLNNFYEQLKTNDTNDIGNILAKSLKNSLDFSKVDIKSLGYSKDEANNLWKQFISDIIQNAKQILDNTFDISNFAYDTKTDDRDLFTYNFRRITPRILEEALSGTGYKNNYQDFMKVYSVEDFIKQNPLGLSSGSLSNLFDNSSSTAFLNTLDKIISDLKEIKEFSSGGAISNAFNIKIDEDSLKSFTEDINRLIESLKDLPSILTNAFSALNANSDGIKNLDPLKNLESTYNTFKKFYDNNDLDSEAGAEAALSYYNAYKEALNAKLNKKDLQQYTIGNTDDLFTGNYTNYKKGVGDLDLSGLNSQIAKYQEIIDKFNQPEAINIINALSEAIQKLLDAGNSSAESTKLLENLNKVINNLGGKNSTEKIDKVVQNLENFQKSVQTLDLSDSGFVKSLSSILEKGEELKALGEVLKSTKKQIDAAGKAVKAEENFKKAQDYLEQYENQIHDAVNQKHENQNETVLYQRLEATKDGLVQIIALIKDANDQYKQFVYTTTNGSDLKVKSTLQDGDPALAKQIKQWEAYEKLKQLAVPGAANLGQDGVTFTPESDNWDKLVAKAKEFGIEVGNIRKIIRDTDRLGNESFQIFTDLSRITVGMNSNGVLFQKDEVLDVNKAVLNFEKNVGNLKKTLISSFKDDMGTDRFLKTLNEITDEYQELSLLHQKGIIDDTEFSSALNYFNAFKNSISSFSLDKISTDNKTPQFINQLIRAENQLDLVKNALDKVESGEAFTEEDIDNVKIFISQIRELNKLSNDKSSKLGNVNKKNNLLSNISDILTKNSAMSKDLKQRFNDLSVEIKSFGDNLPADKLDEFINRFTALKAELKESGQTGLSFFDGIIQRAKSMSQSFISMYLSLYDIIRYVRTGVTYIQELDTTFTEMRKVSDESVQSLKNFQSASFDIANAVGTTAQQIQNSTADWMGEILVPLYGNI